MVEVLPLQVNSDEARLRLDLFLARRVPRLSRSRIRQLIEQGHVRLNGRLCKPRQRLKPGEEVILSEPEPETVSLEPEAIHIPVLYEDDSLIVIDKPAGMVVHPGAGVRRGTVVNALLFQCRNLSGIGGELRPGVVHRLDRDTSGCMVLAKDDFAHARLSAQFATRRVQKFYLALCAGRFRQNSGAIHAPIGRHPVRRQKMTVAPRGREAHTWYRVIQNTPEWSLVLCRIFTGRTHQIRVHMQSVGHPILGDKVYGRTTTALTRQMLHSWRLGFFHPMQENWLAFEAQLPDDFRGSGVDEQAIVRIRSELGDQEITGS